MAVDASSPQWLESIDAVYALFEDEALRSKYPDLAAKVQKAVKLCEEAFTDVGIPKCALSFNGGKDCTVIVHILAAVLKRLAGLSAPRSKAASSASPPAASSSSSSASSSAQPLPPIPTVYIACDSPFTKLEDFIRDSQRRYNLDLYTVTGGMKEGLIEYFAGGGEAGVPEAGRREKSGVEAASSASRRQRDVKAIFIGTRRTDPNGESLQDRQWTDPSWPQVERIHVILDWDYADVWAFLRCPALGVRGEEGVPYCELYDEGYTSLGSTYNTFPNPLLRRGGEREGEGKAAQASFKPAWQLEDGSAERAGRGDKPRGGKAS